MWLHADGAYGAFACLSERGRDALAGIELADSITLDPHKWLYQPVELGALLVRDGAALRRGFEISSDYLENAEAADREVNFSDLGLQLTRTSRALKLWISLRYFGVRRVPERDRPLPRPGPARAESHRAVSRAGADVAGVARHRHVSQASARRRRRGRPGAHQRERGRADRAGRRGIRLHGARARSLRHSALRAQPLDLAGRGRARARAGRVARGRSRTRCVRRGAGELSAARGRVAAPHAAGRRRPAFAAARSRRSTTSRASASCSAPTSTTPSPGEAVVEQWQVSRDLFVILSGAVDVVSDGQRLPALGPGEFFGELAAIDWGAGFSRTRTATVTATEPTRLLVLDWTLVNWLMTVEPRLRRAARDDRAHPPGLALSAGDARPQSLRGAGSSLRHAADDPGPSSTTATRATASPMPRSRCRTTSGCCAAGPRRSSSTAASTPAVGARRGRTCLWAPVDALRALGVEPADVSTVVRDAPALRPHREPRGVPGSPR